MQEVQHQRTVYTIGHWINSVPAFLEMLGQHDIQLFVDVRSFPGSRSNPQFNQEAMRTWLPENGIAYMHLPDLGGRRKGYDRTGPNADWQNESFGAYADYTAGDPWQKSFQELMQLSEEYRTCYGCGEPHPSRCHRLILSDNMEAHDIAVYHIIKDKMDEPVRLERHIMGRWGAHPCVHNGVVTYPATVPIAVQTTLGV